MKAVTRTTYGPPEVLQVTDLPEPVPARNQVRIRVVATTVTTAEAAMRRGEPRWGRLIIGLTRPRPRMRVLGTELAGVVDAVGPDVTRFRVGDEVFGFTGLGLGANAEYVLMPDTGSLAIKPAETTFGQAAAAVDGSTTALYFLRDRARLQPGERVLVIGASGSVGSYAVQIAKHLGAEVTGVCGPDNVDLVRTLGADRVVNHREEDVTAGAETFDVIFDAVGKSSYAACRRILTERGRYVATTGLGNVALAGLTRLRPGPRVVIGMSVEKKEALATIRDLIEAGRLTVVIDQTFPLDRIADAHRYVDSGHKRGNVVIAVAPAPAA